MILAAVFGVMAALAYVAFGPSLPARLWRAIAYLLLCLAVFIAFVLAINAAIAGKAEAHEFWINHSGYKGPDGAHCCGKGDCFIILEADVKIVKGGYSLPSGEVVPFSEAQQSEDGDFWRCKRHDGSRRCFFAPMKGS